MKIDDALRDAVLAAVPKLRAFAISLSGNVDRADDLVQETLLRALANIESFQPGTNLQAWLFTILRNLFRSEYRKRRREVEDTDGNYAESLGFAARAGESARVQGAARCACEIATGPARSTDPRRCVRILVRRGGSHLRMRNRHDQEPCESRTQSSCNELSIESAEDLGPDPAVRAVLADKSR